MNFGTKGCMYNCGDECTGECMKVETKTKMSKEELLEEIKSWESLKEAYKEELEMGNDLEMNTWLYNNAEQELKKLLNKDESN